MIIQVHIDDETEKRLRKVADEMGRTIEDLAYAAVANAALEAFRERGDDPAH